MTLKVKYHNKNLFPLEFIQNKSDWIDLRSAETVTIKAFEFKIISLGVSIQLPKGYEAYIVPRSSTFSTWGIIQTNSVGIIDESYCGDNDVWKMPIFALRDTTINENDRICQFRIQPKMSGINFETVKTLKNKDRDGFGSTGKN